MIRRGLFGAALFVLFAVPALAGDEGHHGDGDHGKPCCQQVTLTPIAPGHHSACLEGGVKISTTCDCPGKQDDHGDHHDACTPQEAVICNGSSGASATSTAYTATNPTQSQLFPGPPGTVIVSMTVPAGRYVVEAKASIEGQAQANRVVCQVIDDNNPGSPLDSQSVTPDGAVTTALLGPLDTAVATTLDVSCYLTQGSGSEVHAFYAQLAAKQVDVLVSTP